MQSSYRVPSPTPTHTHTHRVFLLSISPVLSFLCNASSWLSPISPTKINHYKFRIISSFVLISQPHFVLLAWLYSPSPLPLWTSPSGPVTFTSAFTFFTVRVPTHHQSFFIYAKVVADEALRVWSLCPTVVALGYFLCYMSSLCFTMDMQRTGGSVRLL